MEQGLRLLMVGALAVALSGCAGVCAGWEPIRPSSKDEMTTETQRQILKHNEYGEAQRCWTR